MGVMLLCRDDCPQLGAPAGISSLLQHVPEATETLADMQVLPTLSFRELNTQWVLLLALLEDVCKRGSPQLFEIAKLQLSFTRPLAIFHIT